MSARTDLAAAAQTVEGITSVSPRYRQSLAPYTGMVRLASTARGSNGFGRIDTWQVWLALPQDLANAEAWLDAHADALWAALDEEMTVTSLAPAELVVTPGGPSVPGVIVEGARAAG